MYTSTIQVLIYCTAWLNVAYFILNPNFQNLDALHDHLGTIYPGMRAPSFRCTDAEKGNNLILHYYSEREGLQDIVIGIIKTVAQQIHGTEIEMKVCFADFVPPFLGSWWWIEMTLRSLNLWFKGLIWDFYVQQLSHK